MMKILLVIFSGILALAGLYLFVQGFIIRRAVLKRIQSYEEAPLPGFERTRLDILEDRKESELIGLFMPNWSVLRGMLEQELSRASFFLKEVAENLSSEKAFFLAPSRRMPGAWTIPEGCVYSERDSPTDLSISSESDIIQRALSQESIVLDTAIGDTIPEPLAKLGVTSAIVAAVGYPAQQALLVFCNSKRLIGRPPFQVRYTRAHVEFAIAVASLMSVYGVGRLMYKRIMETEPTVKDIWSREKRELLKTHPGWFVAYQDRKRVALEPSLDRLVAALDEKLGTPREPCEFHEIVEQRPVRRGPSPRLRPAEVER